jgi:hypothetical protein
MTRGMFFKKAIQLTHDALEANKKREVDRTREKAQLEIPKIYEGINKAAARGETNLAWGVGDEHNEFFDVIHQELQAEGFGTYSKGECIYISWRDW